MNYVNVAPPGKVPADFSCGAQTYPDHEGTDFGLRDLAAMQEGVSVLASAAGRVLRVRDGSEDIAPSPEDIAALKRDKKGCGNGVLIDHGGGWQTIYCHMKKDSIVVKPDQKVRTGAVLGQVGHSGIAEFPHLHFGVFHNGVTVDPFTGAKAGDGCGISGQSLWRPELLMSYVPYSLYAAGFAGTAPDFEAIKQNASSPATLAAGEIEALAFWVAIFGAAEGDKIHLMITDAEGKTVAERSLVQDKTRARQFYFIGKKAGEEKFSPGVYRASAFLSRKFPDGQIKTDEISRLVTLTP